MGLSWRVILEVQDETRHLQGKSRPTWCLSQPMLPFVKNAFDLDHGQLTNVKYSSNRENCGCQDGNGSSAAPSPTSGWPWTPVLLAPIELVVQALALALLLEPILCLLHLWLAGSACCDSSPSSVAGSGSNSGPALHRFGTFIFSPICWAVFWLLPCLGQLQ
ncbi:hypothetical protein BDP27DRAFT_360710 [Rhodocollybia butyracea]|uniref:Uncharacterized protein n=1 Tax=Rhodocollybia butyracea TaxID=206335 RepID=A0A9P5PFX5_9AGAR|nr:hypothetical protein BDP27DRAFT_911605 [Rhodocollybia butyracea]KAF9061400.1 hypothetical protein BDP27DRAFT_360710 [Rhodocollybia butyracea]